jgi:beta-galactosidase
VESNVSRIALTAAAAIVRFVAHISMQQQTPVWHFLSWCVLVGGFVSPCLAQPKPHSANTIVIDARVAPAAPQPLPFKVGGMSPDGHSLSANQRYLMRDGQPWFPIMGEFHYSRYPASDWEQEILKMKAGGIQVISTYVFWIHHEEIEGEFDWTGQRDLRRFVQLCGKHGLYVWIRIGPWDHGEVRNGGLPDWLLTKTAVRQNNREYLEYVSRFFHQIGDQVKGLLWKDGGPIIGVQLENEYSARGHGEGEEHILRLRQIARDAGLDAPFYTVTGWDDAVIPSRDVLPVFGGYPDGFWWRSLSELPPNPNYFFTKIRCQENVGENLTSLHPEIDALDEKYPFLTAEMGGGMELAYHRRPLMTADDTAAMEVVKLGDGVTMYGYYMFHGGTNPDGKRTTLQESQATGYPNDLPLKNYDFQAPLGEFGDPHSSFGVLKTSHLFLNDFGAELAPMTSYFPQRMPTSLHDLETPRVAARLQGSHGFLFINNYQRTYPLPEHRNFQVDLMLPGETIAIPRWPLTIPSHAYTFWPVNLPLGHNVLRYATAQLLCKLESEDTYVFFTFPGIPAEFAFDEDSADVIEAPNSHIERSAGIVYVDLSEPGTTPAIRLRNRDGKGINIVVLSREQARNLWKLNLGGRERLVLSPAQIYTENDRLILLGSDPSELKAGIYPTLEKPTGEFDDTGQDGIFHTYQARIKPVKVTAAIEKVAGPGTDSPLKMGKEIVLMPDESAFERAATWRIRIPEVKSDAVSDFLLRITYQGDIARAYADGKLLTDDFYDGQPWVIGLSRTSPDSPSTLEIRILPLQSGAPIYLPSSARPIISPKERLADLKSAELMPVYRAVIDASHPTGSDGNSIKFRPGYN